MNLSNLVQYKRSILLLLITTVLPFTVSSIATYLLSEYNEELLSFHLKEWVLFFSITSFTMAFALTPTTFIALVSGYFLGVNGLYGLLPSYLIASIIGFYLSRKIDKGNFITLIQPDSKLKFIIENLRKNTFWMIVYVRISPALPFAMMNVFLAFLKTPFRQFLLGSFVGMLPRTILSVWLGSKAKDILRVIKGEEEFSVAEFALLGLFLISAIGLFTMIKRAMKKELSNKFIEFLFQRLL